MWILLCLPWEGEPCGQMEGIWQESPEEVQQLRSKMADLEDQLKMETQLLRLCVKNRKC